MKLRQSIKMAMSAVASNKMRSFLTMLGIIIGVMAVTLLISIVQGGTSVITDSMESLGGNRLTVSVRAQNKKLTYAELQGLEEIEGISAVVPYLSGQGTATAGGNSADISLLGITEGYQYAQDMNLAEGRNLTEFDRKNRLQVCVIGAGAAGELFGTAQALDREVRIMGYDYRVVGVLEEEDDSAMGSSNDSIYVPLTNAQRMLKQSSVTSFYVLAENENVLHEAQTAVDDYLYDKFGSDDSYTIINMSDVADMMDTVLETLSLMLGGIAGISLLVGGIGIMNIMLVSVTERTKEIGIRKAIGAGQFSIMAQFLTEALMVSMMGCMAGIVLSALILKVAGMFVSDMSFSISPQVTALAVGFSAFIGIVFGIYPAWKAARKHPIDALRYSG